MDFQSFLVNSIVLFVVLYPLLYLFHHQYTVLKTLEFVVHSMNVILLLEIMLVQNLLRSNKDKIKIDNHLCMIESFEFDNQQLLSDSIHENDFVSKYFLLFEFHQNHQESTTKESVSMIKCLHLIFHSF